jgi:hypothetical protein
MLNVAIAVDSATDFGPQAVHVVAAACEEVIGEHRCPVANDLAPGAVAAWYAVVHPNDPGLSSVRVEFRDRTADGVLIEERLLTFSTRDSQKSRLVSLGSVIAALAAAREGSLTRLYTRRDELQPSAPLFPTVSPREIAPPDWSIDLATLVAPGFGDGVYRLGGLAGAHLGFHGHPFGLASGRYAVHPGNPSFSWLTLSAGVGARIGDRAAKLSLEFSGEFVFEHTYVAADRGADHASASQNGWGGRIEGSVVWGTWRHCSVMVSIDGTMVLPRINVSVGPVDTTRLPLISLGLGLGVRLLP